MPKKSKQPAGDKKPAQTQPSSGGSQPNSNVPQHLLDNPLYAMALRFRDNPNLFAGTQNGNGTDTSQTSEPPRAEQPTFIQRLLNRAGNDPNALCVLGHSRSLSCRLIDLGRWMDVQPQGFLDVPDSWHCLLMMGFAVAGHMHSEKNEFDQGEQRNKL